MKKHLKFTKLVIVILAVLVIVQTLRLRSARYENNLQKESIQNWSDLSDFQNSKGR